MAPLAAKEIAVYDIKRGEFVSLEPLKERSAEKFPKGIHPTFNDSFVSGSSVIFTPLVYDYFVIYDTVSETLSYIESKDWRSDVSDFCKVLGYYSKAVTHGDDTFIAGYNHNAVMHYSGTDKIFNEIELPGDYNGFSCICYGDDAFWLCTNEGEIVKANLDFTKTETVYSPDQSHLSKTTAFINIVYRNNKIWAFPFDSNHIVTVDPSNKIAEISNEYPISEIEDTWTSYDSVQYSIASVIGTKLFLYRTGGFRELIVSDSECETQETHTLSLSEEDEHIIYGLKQQGFTAVFHDNIGPSIYENEIMNIYDYIRVYAENTTVSQNDLSRNSSAFNPIYSFLTEKLEQL
jgi:hypothetical protein